MSLVTVSRLMELPALVSSDFGADDGSAGFVHYRAADVAGILSGSEQGKEDKESGSQDQRRENWFPDTTKHLIDHDETPLHDEKSSEVRWKCKGRHKRGNRSTR